MSHVVSPGSPCLDLIEIHKVTSSYAKRMQAANAEITELGIFWSLLERLDVVVHGDISNNQLQLVRRQEASRTNNLLAAVMQIANTRDSPGMLPMSESEKRLTRVDEIQMP